MRFSEIMRKRFGDIYFELGSALTDFGLVEHQLNLHYYVALGTNRYDHSTRAFWSVHSFISRYDMVNTTLSARLEPWPEEANRWKKLENPIRKANKRRNKLAHGSAITMVKNGKEVNVYAPHYWQNAASSKNPIESMFLEERPDPDTVLTAKDISSWANSFRKLEFELRDSFVRIAKLLNAPRPQTDQE